MAAKGRNNRGTALFHILIQIRDQTGFPVRNRRDAGGVIRGWGLKLVNKLPSQSFSFSIFDPWLTTQASPSFVTVEEIDNEHEHYKNENDEDNPSAPHGVSSGVASEDLDESAVFF